MKQAKELSQQAQQADPLSDPDLFMNRELSWLAFNERVLGEAKRSSNPLMERLKFLAIFASNLDEFFMVRLSGLLKLLERQSSGTQNLNRPRYNESELEETLDEVSLKVRTDLAAAHELLHKEIIPKMKESGIELVRMHELDDVEMQFVSSHFQAQIFPVLTPLAVDPAHPFPYLSNLSLYLAVQFEEYDTNGEPLLAFVEVPRQLPRLLHLPRNGKYRRYILLEDVVKIFLSQLFPWTQVKGAFLVRVTRNLDYQLLEGEVQDLMRSIETELRDREQKFVLRLEVEATLPDLLKQRLRTELELDSDDVYEVPQFVGAADLREFLKIETSSDLRDPPFNPRIHPDLGGKKNFFAVIAARDILLHHPFDSFVSVAEFVEHATTDPDVLAIKMTLYRGGGNSPIIESLVKAAERGKQVTVVVELKARFDEENNIVWARRLERAGAHVVFGFVGLKTHCKCLLVIRREKDQLKRYVHLSTGNYNHATAKLYTDIGMLTSNDLLTQDIVNLFNLLTGFNIIGSKSIEGKSIRLPNFNLIKVAPFNLREHFIEAIEQEVEKSKSCGIGRIVLKMNSLTDMALIKALYKASQNGVTIDLLVRGVCVLLPGVPGISERISVRSIVDRFLEHSRIAWFYNGGNPRVFLGSSDFMPRNMDRRIEVVWPVVDSRLLEKLTEILTVYLNDNSRSHVMSKTGEYERVERRPGEKEIRAQFALIDVARRIGLKGISYDLALEHQSSQKRNQKDKTETESQNKRRSKKNLKS